MTCSDYGSSRRPEITSCRWTIAAQNASTRILPDVRCSFAGTSQVLANGMGDLNENGLINVKNKSHSITAQVDRPGGKPAQGVILSQGGIAGGWMFYVKDGKLTYLYNLVGLAAIPSSLRRKRLPPGKHQVRMEFAYDGGGLAKGGTVNALHRRKTRRRRIVSSKPCRMIFSADETSRRWLETRLTDDARYPGAAQQLQRIGRRRRY